MVKDLNTWLKQSGEPVHKFLHYLNKYKINLLDDESYSKRLMKALVEFSSQHLNIFLKINNVKMSIFMFIYKMYVNTSDSIKVNKCF